MFTHGDLALEVEVDYFAVVEHRLIRTRVCDEWALLKAKGIASIWASQDSSHVGNAGVGVVSVRCSCCYADFCHCSVQAVL